jgi:phosphate acyltransferase
MPSRNDMEAVALDAMGGDHAPAATVQGAAEAVEQHGLRVLLVGQEATLRREMARLGTPPRGLEIVDAPEVVAMDDPPTAVLRAKRRSSMNVALELVRDGMASAFVTAGNSGAAMVAAKRTLGMIEGVERPALAALLPGLNQRTLIVDAGANMDCKPHWLLHFGVMGHFFSEAVLKVKEPRVGLLSVGEEEGKGNQVTLEAYPLLADAGLRFVGNVEGRDVYRDAVDVVVCDGFVGNVVLKVSEGLGEMVRSMLGQEARRSAFYAAGFFIAKGAFSGFRKRVDYAEVGGAPLLGVRGACLVGHGRSNPRAIRNAVRFAHVYATNRVVEHITERVAQLRAQAASEGN